MVIHRNVPGDIRIANRISTIESLLKAKRRAAETLRNEIRIVLTGQFIVVALFRLFSKKRISLSLRIARGTVYVRTLKFPFKLAPVDAIGAFAALSLSIYLSLLRARETEISRCERININTSKFLLS